jgi:alkylhydroperoxidase family enzyme
MNGRTFCLDMHVKQAKIHGEHELRLYHLAAWRESTLFIPRERAAWPRAQRPKSRRNAPCSMSP